MTLELIYHATVGGMRPVLDFHPVARAGPVAFLDACDPYVMNELEVDGDEDDASYPEGGARMVEPMEDDEEAGDEHRRRPGGRSGRL